MSEYNIPPGEYTCQVAEVRTRKTNAGDTLWALRLVVVEGEHVGKHAAWDNLVFSLRGINRCRKVLGVLDAAVPREPAETEYVCRALVGKRALVQIRPAKYTDAAGVMVERNEVPYDGWREIPPKPAPADILERVVKDAQPSIQDQAMHAAQDCPLHGHCQAEAGRVLILVSALVALWDLDELKTEAGKELVRAVLRKVDVDVEAR